jgi:FkbM family methyltransferase
MKRRVKWLSRVAEYAYYGTHALDVGVPVWRLPAMRNAVNLIDALSRVHLGAPVRIVDVGAYRGEWAAACAKLFPKAHILSLEPVPEYYRKAASRASRFPRWEVLCKAAGPERGTRVIDVRGLRSSFKRITGEQFPEWASSTDASEGGRRVDVEPLDELLAQRNFYPVDLLKIDAEGFEREILLGASDTLRRTRQIIIEVRFYELFEGGPLFWEVHELLGAHGFVLRHLKPCKGICLWADATYARSAGTSGLTSLP